MWIFKRKYVTVSTLSNRNEAPTPRSPKGRKAFAATETFLGLVVQFHDQEGVIYSLLDVLCLCRQQVLCRRTPNTSFFAPFLTLFLLLCSDPRSPFGLFQVTFPLLWSSPSHLLLSPLSCSATSHEGHSDRGATVLWQSKGFSCPVPAVRECCKCQPKCQQRALPLSSLPFEEILCRDLLISTVLRQSAF